MKHEVSYDLNVNKVISNRIKMSLVEWTNDDEFIDILLMLVVNNDPKYLSRHGTYLQRKSLYIYVTITTGLHLGDGSKQGIPIWNKYHNVK